jgi:hypothetical protein
MRMLNFEMEGAFDVMSGFQRSHFFLAPSSTLQQRIISLFSDKTFNSLMLFMISRFCNQYKGGMVW